MCSFKWICPVISRTFDVKTAVLMSLLLMSFATYAEVAEPPLESYRLAAKQGDPDAQFKIGLMFFEGKETTRDYKKADKWFKLAANQGQADAQYYRGLIFQDGLGTSKDPEKSNKWLTAAAEQEHTLALQKLNPGQTNNTSTTAAVQETTTSTVGPAYDVPDSCNYAKGSTEYNIFNSASRSEIPEVAKSEGEWRAAEQGLRSNPQAILDGITGDHVRQLIHQSCTGDVLRARITNVVQGQRWRRFQNSSSVCFIEPTRLQRLVDLSDSIQNWKYEYSYDALTRCDSNDGDPGQCKKLRKLIDSLVATEGASCEKYFGETYYSGFFARIDDRNKQKAEAAVAAKRAQEAEQQRAEQARMQKIASERALAKESETRNEVFSASGLSSKSWVIWGSESQQSAGLRKADEQSLLNSINV